MMEIKKIDAMGLSCPQPVILATKALDAGELPFEIRVDTVTARENVTRIAKKKGCSVSFSENSDEGTFTLIIDRA